MHQIRMAQASIHKNYKESLIRISFPTQSILTPHGIKRRDNSDSTKIVAWKVLAKHIKIPIPSIFYTITTPQVRIV